MPFPRLAVALCVAGLLLIAAIRPDDAAVLLGRIVSPGTAIAEETPGPDETLPPFYYQTPQPLPSEETPPSPLPPVPTEEPTQAEATPMEITPTESPEPEQTPEPTLEPENTQSPAPPIPYWTPSRYTEPTPMQVTPEPQAPTPEPQAPTPEPQAPTPQPVVPTGPSAEMRAQIAADRQALALLNVQRGKLELALQRVEQLSKTQSKNAAEINELRDNVAQDLVSDSLGFLSSDLFLSKLGSHYNLPAHDIEDLKHLLENMHDAVDAQAAIDAAQAAGEHPEDTEQRERAREKTLSLESSMLKRLTGMSDLPADARERLGRFVEASFETIKTSESVERTTGSTYTRVANALDGVAGIVGAINPEVGAIRSGINVVGGAWVLHAIHSDSQAIRDAQQSIDRARTSLEGHLRDIDAQRRALQEKIQGEVTGGQP